MPFHRINTLTNTEILINILININFYNIIIRNWGEDKKGND